MNRPAENACVLFLHIPKAAGTTLHTVIERQYPQEQVYTIDGADPDASIRALQAVPVEIRRDMRCVKGHFSFGLHEDWPGPCTYITLLRDPVDRIVSHYYYVLRRPSHYLHQHVHSRGLSLHAYANSGLSEELANHQTRMIAGDVNSASLLETAKRNVREHFCVAGVVEEFNQALVLMSRRLGWKDIAYQMGNVTADRPSREDVPPETRRAIERRNELDLELYDYCSGLFRDAVRAQRADFWREVEQLRISHAAAHPCARRLAI